MSTSKDSSHNIMLCPTGSAVRTRLSCGYRRRNRITHKCTHMAPTAAVRLCLSWRWWSVIFVYALTCIRSILVCVEWHACLQVSPVSSVLFESSALYDRVSKVTGWNKESVAAQPYYQPIARCSSSVEPVISTKITYLRGAAFSFHYIITNVVKQLPIFKEIAI